MKQRRFLAAMLGAALALGCCFPANAAGSLAHDPDRDVQKEGVGNPFGYTDRNTPADASTAEIRAINHAMSVQEVKYALYKEIDEHWDLVTVRFGQTDREKVYALFLGIGSRESTLGGNGDGADIETAFSEGFGVSSAHAYGTLQTAVTAFKDCDPTFMQEDDVPEMEHYSFTEANFYDAIISDHMGLRKVIHFIRSGIVDYGLEGWQIVRGALKGFNTGWANYTGDNMGYYADYPDEIIALAAWYYNEGHLYDDVFTWTNAAVAEPYRNIESWSEWWYDKEPSLAEIPEKTEPAVTTTSLVTTTTVTTTTEAPVVDLLGDVNLSGNVTVADAVLLGKALARRETLTAAQAQQADMDENNRLDVRDLTLPKRVLLS